MITNRLPLFINENLHKEDFFTGDEAHHATNVLRIREGSQIQITNGKGTIVKATVTMISKNRINYTVIETFKQEKPPYGLHLAVAPTKNIERYEFMIEKCTEFGFSTLTPVICEHSERLVIKTERLKRIMMAAAKQSLNTNFPVINEPLKFKDFILKNNNIGRKLIALCTHQTRISIANAVELNIDNTVLVGPEGDFSESEINLALTNNFIPVSLGNSRLRTETAGIAVCHSFYIRSY